MSPFLVYLLFQADSISILMGVLGAGLLLSALILAIPSFNAASYSWEKKEEFDLMNATYRPWFRRCIISSICLFSISALLPSTKTIAAMIILPKITSPQALDTMGKESRDIYELAKKALANLADDKPASTEKK